MKKTLSTLALLSASLGLMAQGLMAQDNLSLQSGQLLDATLVNQTVLREGQTRENVWFSVETNRVEGSSPYKLNSCILSTNLSLNSGRLGLQTKMLRCISDTGEIFTDKAIQANLTASLSEICSSSGSRCSEITLQAGQNYVFEVRQNTSMTAEFNASREVNRIRLEQGI